LLAEENLQLKYSLGTPDREGVISVEKWEVSFVLWMKSLFIELTSFVHKWICVLLDMECEFSIQMLKKDVYLSPLLVFVDL
jgi:hypothetical protein